jgi:hypothetical protein
MFGPFEMLRMAESRRFSMTNTSGGWTCASVCECVCVRACWPVDNSENFHEL